MAAKRTRINCCPTPAPRAVFIYTIDPLSNCVDNMELARLFSRSGASATSSATSASPTPSASPSTSRPSPSTPSTPWRVRTKQYIIEPSTNLRLVSYLLALPFFLFKVPTSLLQLIIYCDTMLIRMKRRC